MAVKVLHVTSVARRVTLPENVAQGVEVDVEAPVYQLDAISVTKWDTLPGTVRWRETVVTTAIKLAI